MMTLSEFSDPADTSTKSHLWWKECANLETVLLFPDPVEFILPFVLYRLLLWSATSKLHTSKNIYIHGQAWKQLECQGQLT